MPKFSKLLLLSVGICLSFSLKLGVIEVHTIESEGEISISSPYTDEIDLLLTKTNVSATAEDLELLDDLIIKNNMWFENNAKRLLEQKYGLKKTARIELNILFWILMITTLIVLLSTKSLHNTHDFVVVMSLPLLLTVFGFFMMYQFISILVVICITLLIKFVYGTINRHI